VRATKADHAAGGNLSTAPSRFAESRTSTDRSATATSAQSVLSDELLFRHALCGSPKPAT